jgi:hypothetical protein
VIENVCSKSKNISGGVKFISLGAVNEDNSG